MSLNIKNPRVLALVEEIVAQTGETKTEAIRCALKERKARLALRGSHARRIENYLQYMEQEFWPSLPPGVVGRPTTKEEIEEILGMDL